jgi:hypothetical protein
MGIEIRLRLIHDLFSGARLDTLSRSASSCIPLVMSFLITTPFYLFIVTSRGSRL